MTTMKIIKRKNILIKNDCVTKTWTQVINPGFTPDSVKIKNIVYCGDADPTAKSNDIRFIWCSNLGGYIGSFYDGCTNPNNITFPASHLTYGSEWEFMIKDMDDDLDTLFDGDIAFFLEFTQYA